MEVFPLAFPPAPISKVRRQRRKPCPSGAWNARRRFFKWLVAKSSDLRAYGIFFCLKPAVELIWNVCDPSALAYGWICELMRDMESLKNSLFRSRVPWRSQGVCAAQMNLFLFVFSFSRLISHLIKPCLSFWGFCHFFSLWDHTRRASWLGLGWGNLQKAIVHSSIIKSCSLASICPVAYILEHNSKHFQEDNQQKHRLIIAFRLQQDLKQDKYVCSPHLCLTENWSASPGQEGF